MCIKLLLLFGKLRVGEEEKEATHDAAVKASGKPSNRRWVLQSVVDGNGARGKRELETERDREGESGGRERERARLREWNACRRTECAREGTPSEPSPYIAGERGETGKGSRCTILLPLFMYPQENKRVRLGQMNSYSYIKILEAAVTG